MKACFPSPSLLLHRNNKTSAHLIVSVLVPAEISVRCPVKGTDQNGESRPSGSSFTALIRLAIVPTTNRLLLTLQPRDYPINPPHTKCPRRRLVAMVASTPPPLVSLQYTKSINSQLIKNLRKTLSPSVIASEKNVGRFLQDLAS